MQPDKQLVQQLIQEGKTQDAIDALKKLAPGEAIKKTLLIIEAEFNTLQKEHLKGLIDLDQKQVRTNRIHDKLLSLLEEKSSTASASNRKVLYYLIPLLLIAAAVIVFQLSGSDSRQCPEFDEGVTNKILLIPFENLRGTVAQPHLVLRNKIEELVKDHNLSTSIKIGDLQTPSIFDAPNVARACGANVIIWGGYSNSDSIRLTLNYNFLDDPDWDLLNELITLKDVTHLQEGEVLKDLEDSVMWLCSIIALRQNKPEKTQKWLNKIKEKEDFFDEIYDAIDQAKEQPPSN